MIVEMALGQIKVDRHDKDSLVGRFESQEILANKFYCFMFHFS